MDHLSLFATPVLVFTPPGLEEVNEELVRLLVAEAQAMPGVQRSNVGGWHSVPDLSQRQGPCYQRLMTAMVGCVGEALAALSPALEARPRQRYGLQAWAMIMRDGDYVVPHEHGEAPWSVVYYADAGDSDGSHPHSGLLAFSDPRGARAVAQAVLFPSTFTVRPRSGMLVLFPGWLQHYVHPYRGQRPRVSVSCNVTFANPPISR